MTTFRLFSEQVPATVKEPWLAKLIKAFAAGELIATAGATVSFVKLREPWTATPPVAELWFAFRVITPSDAAEKSTFTVQVPAVHATEALPSPERTTFCPVSEQVPEIATADLFAAFTKLPEAGEVMATVGWARPVTLSPLAVVDGIPPKVQFRESVAVREPTAVGTAFTEIVQFPPLGPTFEVPQVSEVIVKSPGLVPLRVGAEHPVAVAVPEFVRVKTWTVDEPPPVLTDPKFLVSGDQVSVGWMPVTIIIFEFVEAVLPTVQVRDKVVGWAPEERGFPRMLTVHVPPDAVRFAVPQVSVRIVKFVVSVIEGGEQPVAAAPPEFVNVKVWVEELNPTLIGPKSWESGDHAKAGASPVTVIELVDAEAEPQVKPNVVDLAPADVGFAFNVTVQVPAGEIVEVQVSAVIVKSVEFVFVVAVQLVAFVPPVFVRVKPCVAEFEPTAVPANAKVAGVHASADGAFTVIERTTGEDPPEFVPVTV
jgi:hypothetical protein